MSGKIDYSSSDDFEGNHVSVVSTTQRHKAGVFVGGPVHAGRNRQIAVIKKDDAPAAALALLQASGWVVDPEKVADFNPPHASSDVYIQAGIAYLSFAIEAKACEDAEAMYDAEYEAEVLELAKAIFKVMHPSANWEEANEFIKGDCIKQARVAYAHMKGKTND